MAAFHAQPPPPGQQPPPYPIAPVQAGDQTPISTYMMGGLIICALTGILLLIDDFGGAYWRTPATENWIWLGAFSTYWGFLIMFPLSLIMFYMAYWCSQAMREPRMITVSSLTSYYRYSLFTFAIMLLLGIAWASYATWEEFDEWWFDVAFYAGIIGSVLAAIIFNHAKKQAETLGYPR
ncbi:MAG: hypothetical protein LN414_00420 [Candidatus Thermoplasmatota archaeon]|nr:hypothetical protein [Candidatus Thermoplasmatota archaeon]